MADEKASASATGGVGVFGLLGVAFVVLKLTHVINWSWWWVLAPFWVPTLVFLGIAAIAFVIWVIVESRKPPRRF